MGARKFLSILVSAFLCISIWASEPVTTYSNTIETTDGSIKEYTLFSNDTKEPLKKSTFKYNLNGNILEKIVYTWEGKNLGWVASQKLIYSYVDSGSNKPISLTLLNWDKRNNNWTETTTMDYSNIE